MTVSSTNTRKSYSGNGTTTAFSYPYPFFAAADLTVKLFDTVANAWVHPDPVLNGSATWDYTVTGTFDAASGEYDAGGSVNFNNAPPSTWKAVIWLALSFTQPVALADASKFPALVINAELDRLTLLAQELNRTAGAPYGIAAPLSDEPDSLSLQLPVQAVRANAGGGSYLGFDGAGNVTTYGIPVTQQLAMQGLKPKNVTGASYQYSSADYGCLVIRSNGGVAMNDVMPQANAGGGLAASTTIAIRNDDTSGWLQLAAAAPNAAATTALEGQVPLRSDGNSLAFFAPGRGAIFAYDTTPALPTWRDATRMLSNLTVADIPTIQLVAGLQGATPTVAASAGSAADYWPSRLIALEAVTGPLAADFQNALYRLWGGSVAVGTATSWPTRASAATYPRDSLPLVNFAPGAQRLIANVGQVIERAATNLLPNPGMTGATVGVGAGDLPTNWKWRVSPPDANTTIAVNNADYPNGTYNTNRIRLTVTRSGSAVHNGTMLLAFTDSTPGLQVPALARGGINFSLMAQVVSSSGVFASAQMQIRETASDGTTFVGTTVGDAIGAAFAATKNRCWRAVPQNNYADCDLLISLSDSLADFSVTLDILVTQLEDSAGLADYTTFTKLPRNAESITLAVPTSGGMGASDLFLQSATRGSWLRNNAAGDVTVSALPGEGFGVLQRVRAYAHGALDWLRSTQAAAVLEAAGTPQSAPGSWSEQVSGNVAQLGSINGDAAYWQVNNADTPQGTASWACNAALNKQASQIVRLELRKGDHCASDGGGAATVERTQLSSWDPNAAAPPPLPMYQDSWFAFSFYLETGAALTGFAANNNWLQLANLWSSMGNTNPLRLELTPAANPGGDGEHLALQIASSGLTVNGVNNPATYYPFTTNTAIARGTWHDVVLRIHPDEHANGNGAADLYLDGMLLFAWRGPLGYAADPPHIRCQLLRPNPSNLPHETIAVEYANIDIRTNGSALTARAGGSFPDVA